MFNWYQFAANWQYAVEFLLLLTIYMSVSVARFDRHRWCFAMAEDERRLGGDHVGEEVEEVEDMMWEDTHMTSTHDDTGAVEDWSEEEVEVCEGKWCVRGPFERGVCVCACRM